MSTSAERSRGTCSCWLLKLKIVRILCMLTQHKIAGWLHMPVYVTFKLTEFSSRM